MDSSDIYLTIYVCFCCRGQCDRVKVSGLSSPNRNNHFNTFKILEEIVHPSFRSNLDVDAEAGTTDDLDDIMLVRIESDKSNTTISARTIALNQRTLDLEQSLSVLRANHTVKQWKRKRNHQHHQGHASLELKHAPALKIMQPNETLVKYIPNENCDIGEHRNGNQGIPKLTLSPPNSFLCVTDANTCNEDYGSGWPLIMKGDSYTDDIQIGISIGYVLSIE